MLEEEEEDKDEEDEAQWSLGCEGQAQMQTIMQTHSLAARGHEVPSPGVIALAGAEGVARVPMPTIATLFWVVTMRHSQVPTPGGTFPEQGGWWSFMNNLLPLGPAPSRLLLGCSHQVSPRIDSHPAPSECLQSQISSPLQAPTAVFENTHSGLMICPCLHGEFPLLKLLLLPLTASL